MDEKEQQAWDECLKLWEILANTETQETVVDIVDFKNEKLEALGINRRQNGCPFCEEYISLGECVRCPINNCYDAPFKAWEDGIEHEGKHHKSEANKFYNYLLKRYEERKLEDNS